MFQVHMKIQMFICALFFVALFYKHILKLHIFPHLQYFGVKSVELF